MINLSYSRISLADVADKLQLGSPEDAEFIIAKVLIVGTVCDTVTQLRDQTFGEVVASCWQTSVTLVGLESIFLRNWTCTCSSRIWT